MTENATPAKTADSATESTEPKTLTAEEKAKIFETLPAEMAQAIRELNNEIETHNNNVLAVKRADEKNPKLIQAEIFEQNPSNNKKIARLLEQYRKVEEALEKIRSEAYEIIKTDGLMPAELTEEKVAEMKANLTASTKDLRDKVSAFEQMEKMMPMFKITAVIESIMTRTGRPAGSRGAAAGSQTGAKKLRFKKILVNGVDRETINGKEETVFQKNANGEEKYTFTNLARFLGKKSATINWTSNDFTTAYLEGLDENNLPETHKFTMTHTYKTESGNEESVNYEITGIR